MKNFISRMSRSFILNNISSFYNDEDFKLVLKHLKRPYSAKGQDEVICNIFRIISLKKTEQAKWEVEYEYLTEGGFLEVFSEYEGKYLASYLRVKLFDEMILLPHIEREKLSKKVREYFPLPT